jgi:hypothetical protein
MKVKRMTHSVESVTLNTATPLRQNWMNDYNSKGAQRDGTMRIVLVKRERKHLFVEHVLLRNETRYVNE